MLATRLRTHTQVLDDRTAYLVDPDPAPSATASPLCSATRSLRERLASQAKAYVQREFTPEAAHRKLASFYTMMESEPVDSA